MRVNEMKKHKGIEINKGLINQKANKKAPDNYSTLLLYRQARIKNDYTSRTINVVAVTVFNMQDYFQASSSFRTFRNVNESITKPLTVDYKNF